MKKQLAWIFGGSAIVGLGFAASVTACSGDDTNTTDSGVKDTAPADNTVKDQNVQDVINPTDGGTDAPTGDCGSTPTLHTSDAGTIFCGYPADGGAGFYCSTGQQCCLGGSLGNNTFAPEMCETFGGICDNPLPDASTSPGAPIECGQNSDCTANNLSGDVCCLKGAGTPTIVSGCSYYKTSGGSSVACEAPTNGACAGGETQICSQQSDCPQGKTCTPMKWKIYQLGFCM